MSTVRANNLRSLRLTNPLLAEHLENTTATALLEILPSRSGHPVPAIRRNGRPLALHSLFDPIREAARLAEAVLTNEGGAARDDAECYLLFEGLGGGYQIRQALARSQPAYVLVLETNPPLLSELISKLDLSDIFADRRVHLLVDPTPEETADWIRSTYLPGVMGPFFSVPLRPRIDMAPALFAALRQAAREALEAAADDYSVQARFGRLWMRNILTNLPLLALRPSTLPVMKEAIVTSAGPSLEDRLEELARLRPGRFLIATDTSLPALLAAGLLPDAVLTIDCQYLSYYHFLSGLPASSILVAELAAPPGIARRAGEIIAVSSGHPLSRLAAAEVGGILPIDTSGGNVGHAAVSLAFELGARSVHLLGSDFSYPLGKPYARGTFIFDYFDERAKRTSPTETGIASLVYRSTTVEREEIPGGFRYTTQSLRAYRDRFVKAFAPRSSQVRLLVVNGLPIEFPSAHRGGHSVPMSQNLTLRSSPSPSTASVRRFIERYREAVAALPNRVPEPTISANGAGLWDEWNIFTTLYPVIALLRERTPTDIRSGALVSQAKRTVENLLRRTVADWYI